MNFKIEAYSIHELGKRQNQEDSLFPSDGKSSAKDRLFILCDGMGGHEKGEVASSTVCEAISQTIISRWKPEESLTDELLVQAIDTAYDALDQKDDDAEKKMGTTLTLLCLHANGATVAHIGDSRVYQFRPEQGIVFRTQDHSLVNDLVKIGEITEEEAKIHPQKNVITRAMQPHQPHRAKADIAHLTDIQSGDYFFLCSDGMLEQTSDENLVNVITKNGISNDEKVKILRNLTADNSDNHTAHLIYIDKVKGNVKQSKNVSADKGPQGVWAKNVNIPPFKPKNNNKTKSNKGWTIHVFYILLLAIVSTFSFMMGGRFSHPKEEMKVDTIIVKDTVYLPKSVKDTTMQGGKDSVQKLTTSALGEMPSAKQTNEEPKEKEQKAEPTEKKKTNNKKQKEEHATTIQGNASTWRHI